MSAAMETEVIRRVNHVADERPFPPHPPGSIPGQHNPRPHNPRPLDPGAHSTGQNGTGQHSTGPQNGGSTPSIADRFADLLAPLSNRRRRGLIARLSVGYYEGWRPSRAEVTELVAEELRRSPR